MKDQVTTVNLKKAINYFGGDIVAANSWAVNCALKDETGNCIEATPYDTQQRLANALYDAESQYFSNKPTDSNLSEYWQTRKDLTRESIFELLADFKYLVPWGKSSNGFFNRGFVVPMVFDDHGQRLIVNDQLVNLYNEGGDMGLDVSNVTPCGKVDSVEVFADKGVLGFINEFFIDIKSAKKQSNAIDLMITIDVRHPDVEVFIDCFEQILLLKGVKFKMKLSNDFMRAVRSENDFLLQWPIESDAPSIKKSVGAKALWDKVIDLVFKNNNFGVTFWEQQHFYSTSSVYPQYKNASIIPSNEMAAEFGGGGPEMVINLFSFVNQPFSDKARFDYEKLYEVAYEGTRLLDDMVDIELKAISDLIIALENDTNLSEPKYCELETLKIRHASMINGRRVGLGITGLADTLAALNKRFDEIGAQLTVDALMRMKLLGELDSTIDMAVERGKFNGFSTEAEKMSDFSSKMMYLEFPESRERMQKNGRRNISFSTVSPMFGVGSVTKTSVGIDPIDDERNIAESKLNLWEKHNPNKGFSHSPYYKCTAQDVNWVSILEIQKIVQKYTTQSVFSVVNSNSVNTNKSLGEMHLKAWEEGLKGVSFFKCGDTVGG